MYYKCHKVNFRCSGSYIDSIDWIKKIKATTNWKNKDDKCFQHAVTVVFNYKEIKWNHEIVLDIKLFKGITYPSKKRWLEIVWEK